MKKSLNRGGRRREVVEEECSRFRGAILKVEDEMCGIRRIKKVIGRKGRKGEGMVE